MCKELKCMECGQEGATNVVSINSKSDSILFPHVDSCLAIILEMKDGSIIGGHALHPGVNDGVGEIEEVVKSMKDKAGTQEIEKVYLIGDKHYESDGVSSLFKAQEINFIDKESDPIDARFSYKSGEWKVEISTCPKSK